MDEQDKKNEYKIRRDRVIRWDNYRITQFSYTNNLLIGLNLAFLGFYISQSGFKFNCNCYLFSLQLLTVLFLITSFVTGLLTVLNRLHDFRKTAQMTKEKKKKFEHDHMIKSHSDIDTINSDIRILDAKTKRLGNTTWTLLRWQVWTFLIGIILGVIYMIIEKNANG